jgi:hypothetical protein
MARPRAPQLASRAVIERLKSLLEQASLSLDCAATNAPHDPEATVDDVLAARLLVLTALATLNAAPFVG